MTALDGAYRPRLPTRKEIEEDKERQAQLRERFHQRRSKEREAVDDSRTARLVYSNSGIAYRDYTLGPSKPTSARAKLDRDVYLARRARRPLTPEPLDEVPRLSAVCLAVVVENYGEPGVFDCLDPAHHAQHVGPLLDALSDELEQDDLPFQVFLDLGARSVLPSKRRTYRGLVVSDVDELTALQEINAESVELFAQQQALSSSVDFPPPFFLSFLDLSGEVGFGDGDIHKLKNPLSHFLAVLRLDGTSVTDSGLSWIARAADEPPRYGHLQVLSLRNLPKVTDEGVVKLAKLNLRSLVYKKLNAALLDFGSTAFFRTARPWPAHPAPALELQLFDPSNFSLSRTLSLLHHLATYHTSPASARTEVLKQPLVKPIAVHLTAMSRRVVDSAKPVKAEKSAQELYTEQLALAAGSTHAAHHRAFGAVTSTVPLSRKAVEEDGHAESDRGAAFRTARSDAVAAGLFVGESGKNGGGRASLYDVGTRRVGVLPCVAGGRGGARDRYGVRTDRDPFSDSEGEADEEAAQAAKLAEAQRSWDAATGGRQSFYAGKRPQGRGPRVFNAPAGSPFMLIRPFPVRGLCEPVEVLRPRRVEIEGEEEPLMGREGVVKKKRRVDEAPSGFFSASPSGTPSFASRPQPRPSEARPRLSAATPASSAVSSPSPSTSSTVKPPPSNPFGKKRPLATPRHAPKNIVKTAPTLKPRSGLTAFGGRKK
ncbi:hypothetical protein JCM8097_007997 [Rhodosporidiobolus ruineniae]